MKTLVQLFGSGCPWNFSFQTLAAGSPAAHQPQALHLWINTLDVVRQKWVSLAVSYSAGHSQALCFPHGRNNRSRGFSWHWAVLPWWLGDVDEVKLFFLLAPTSPVSDILLQQCVGRIARLPQRLLPMGDCKSQWSPRNLAVQPRGLEPVHGPFQSLWPGPRSCYMCMQNSSQVHWHMGLDPITSTRHFCLWLDTTLLFLRYMDEVTSYLPILLMSLSNHIFP